MEKAASVGIVNITAGSSSMGGGGITSQVFGLGDDNKVYFWESSTHKWLLFSS